MNFAPPTDRFEDRVLTAILDDFDALSAPAAAPTRSRQIVALRRTAPALVAAAAAVAVVVATVPGHSGKAPAGRIAITTPKLHTASFVIKKMTAATAGGPYVVVETGRAPDSQSGDIVYSKSWFIPGGPTSRDEVDDANGNPVSATVSTDNGDGTHRVISIDYAAKTWSATTYSDEPTGSPGPLPQTPQQNADRLRKSTLDGNATVVGAVTVDGQQAIELQQGDLQNGIQLTWVDASTYLPIRELDTAPGEPVTSASRIQTDDIWLPATSDNRQLVTADAAIPAGFTHVGG